VFISFKRLLVVSITLLLGVMSGEALAATYDFTFDSENSPGYLYEVLLTTNSSNQVSSIDGFYAGGTNYSSLLDSGTTTSITESTVNSVSNYSLFFNYANTLLDPSQRGGFWANSGGGFSMVSGSPAFGHGNDMIGVASSSGAPEIDGSLAPKVGFLLGCLFLMLGRRKQNTEALMTA